jgi:hypothetical protein
MIAIRIMLVVKLYGKFPLEHIHYQIQIKNEALKRVSHAENICVAGKLNKKTAEGLVKGTRYIPY